MAAELDAVHREPSQTCRGANRKNLSIRLLSLILTHCGRSTFFPLHSPSASFSRASGRLCTHTQVCASLGQGGPDSHLGQDRSRSRCLSSAQVAVRPRYLAVWRLSTEVVPPLNSGLKAAGPPSVLPPSSLPAKCILGPLQNLPLCGRGRSLSAGPLPQPEAPPVHPSPVPLCAPWGALLLASSFTKGAVLARSCLQPGHSQLLGLHPHLRHLPSSTFALHPSLSPTVLALQAQKKKTKAKKDKAPRNPHIPFSGFPPQLLSVLELEWAPGSGTLWPSHMASGRPGRVGL